jgi:DnaK suppressor protein
MSGVTAVKVSGASGDTNMKAETFLPDNYAPAEDEPFMNERQVE